ncbi:hypothetical protein KZ813_03130 [Sphingomonas sp. RHCKR7]|nr:hypothetical protein [Sphingomonas folli]
MSGNVSAARASGTFASVHDQAGIHAGAGGYQVDVRHHTQLDGGAIESSAAPERNSFTTGTLGFSDIRNSEAWSSGQTSFGGGWGAGGSDAKGQATSGQGEVPGSARGGAGRVSAGLPVAMSARGSQTSVTRSAISPGMLTVTSDDPASQVAAATISRDPGAANAPLVREFDADKRAGLERGFETVRTLGVESTTFLAHRAEDDAKWREAHPDAKPSESPYATWGAGGTGQRVITAAVGAASGDVGGSLGGLVQGAAATLAQGWATERVKSLVGNDDEHLVLRALAQGAVACAGSVAGGGSCGGAALGAATSVGVHELLKTGATPAVDADGEPLTQREAQRRDHLVATVAGATASMLGLDPGAAITAAQVESENNSTVTKHGIFGPETKTGLSVDDVYKNSPEFRAAVEKIGGLSKFAEVAACASSPQSCSLNEQQQNALDAYSLASQTIEGQNAIDARLCSGDTPLSCAIQKANAFNKTPEGVRLAGGIEAVGGTAGVVADGFTMAAGTAACPGSIGAGCGAAALAGINAATNVDRIVAGAKQAVTAIPGETYGARAISSVTGASPAAAEAIYGLSTLGLGFGASRLNATGDVRQPIAFSEERYEGGSNLDAADGEATTNPLTGGVNHESERLAALGIPKNHDIWPIFGKTSLTRLLSVLLA